MKNIPDYSRKTKPRSKNPSYSKSPPRYVPSFSPTPDHSDQHRFSSSYDHEVEKHQPPSVPSYEDYGQISFDETRVSSPVKEYSPSKRQDLHEIEFI